MNVEAMHAWRQAVQKDLDQHPVGGVLDLDQPDGRGRTPQRRTVKVDVSVRHGYLFLRCLAVFLAIRLG